MSNRSEPKIPLEILDILETFILARRATVNLKQLKTDPKLIKSLEINSKQLETGCDPLVTGSQAL
jgi:hypothetical protein